MSKETEQIITEVDAFLKRNADNPALMLSMTDVKVIYLVDEIKRLEQRIETLIEDAI